jgi:ABC-type antimicrobial peptide transport system permease subunit
MDRDEEIHVPLSTAMRRLLNIDYVMGAKIRFADANAAKQAPGAITRLLRERHHLQDGEPDDFSLLTPVMVQEKVSSMGRVFSLYIPLLSLVCLVIGGIVIVNIMLITVGERKSEIGLRKAVGARAKDILTQFLFETAALTLSGGVLGSLLGFLGVLGISLVLKNRIDVSWTAAVLGLFGSAAIGVLAGLLPARRAAALQPAEALR